MEIIKIYFRNLTTEILDLSLSSIASGVVTVIIGLVRIIAYLPSMVDRTRAINSIVLGTRRVVQLIKNKCTFNRRKS